MNIDNIQEHIRNTHYYHYQTILDRDRSILVCLSI
jgi:hypothetical protein